MTYLIGLLGNQPLGFADDLVRARVARRAFDHDDVVLEVRDHGAVTARDQPEAAAEIFALHGSGSAASTATSGSTFSPTRSTLAAPANSGGTFPARRPDRPGRRARPEASCPQAG